MLKENDIIITEGVDYTSEGIGLAKHDGQVIFVNNLIIGEEAEIKITKVKRSFSLGKIIRFTKVSPHRITPLIAESIHLGGCQFSQLEYKEEVSYKLSKVNRALRVIGGLDYEVRTIHAAKSDSFYRNKSVLPLKKLNHYTLISGMYRYNSHDIVNMEKTHLDDERVAVVMKAIKKLLLKYKYTIYNEKTHVGDVRKVMVRVSQSYDEIMVVLITKNVTLADFNRFINELIVLVPTVTTVIQNINDDVTNVNLGEKEVVHYGSGFIKDRLLGLEFNISSKSFFQVNSAQTEVLYTRALALAQLTKEDVLLDAYSGIGTIALAASKEVSRVIGVEIVKEAVLDANENAKRNNITNATFVRGDSGHYISENIQKENITAVIVDPPRKGLSEQFIDVILKQKIKKFIYVSCDPATLARDLAKLTTIYNIAAFECVDMFPRTSHVENIVLLSLKTT